MKKLIVVLVVIGLIVSFCLPALAAQGGRRGASEKAYEHASDEAVFNRVGDWFATRGKTEEEKQAIIAERKAKTAQKQLEKEARKAKKEAEKEAKKAKKEIQERFKGLPKRGQ